MTSDNVLPLVLAAALHHPSAALRQQLTTALDEWVAGLQPWVSENEVRELLSDCAGTTLEPFTLDDADAYIASLLARAAFSETCRQTRLRIVSRDTLGAEGGCVLTNNMTYHYVERLGNERFRTFSPDQWRFIPRNAPAIPIHNSGQVCGVAKLLKSVSASIQADAALGYKIVVAGLDLDALHWPQQNATLLRRLQEHSTIGTTGETLSSLGLRAEMSQGSLTFHPGTPEALMRMTAHLVDASLMVIQPGAGPTPYKIFIALDLPEDEELRLSATVAVGDNVFADWLHAPMQQGPVIGTEQKRAIGQWIFPHQSWITDDYIKAI